MYIYVCVCLLQWTCTEPWPVARTQKPSSPTVTECFTRQQRKFLTYTIGEQVDVSGINISRLKSLGWNYRSRTKNIRPSGYGMSYYPCKYTYNSVEPDDFGNRIDPRTREAPLPRRRVIRCLVDGLELRRISWNASRIYFHLCIYIVLVVRKGDDVAVPLRCYESLDSYKLSKLSHYFSTNEIFQGHLLMSTSVSFHTVARE